MQFSEKNKIRFDIAYLAVLLVVAAGVGVLGLMLLRMDWRVLTDIRSVIGGIVGLYVLFVLQYLYLRKELAYSFDRLQVSRLRGCLLTYLVVSGVILAGCLVYGIFDAYAMPIAASALLLTILLRERIGFVGTVVTALSVLVLILAEHAVYPDTVTIMHSVLGVIFGFISGIFMLFLIWKNYSRLRVTWGTILLSMAMTPIAWIFAWMEYGTGVFRILEAGGIALLGNAAAIAIFTILQPILEIIFRVWSDFKLAEICSFHQPLLKQLREEAPGTFNHALTVANLVESCAMAIGLDPYMARACAYFHDIGKIKNPSFFVENQKDGYNPHDELIPEMSAKIITRHTGAGAEILRAARMPEQVIKAANEHHGDTPVMYFYLKAKGITEGELEDNQFRYTGPRPTTKYSAIMMICDICEAMTRSKAPDTEEQLEELVGNIIREKLLDGQFDDCSLTLKELHTIKMTICDVIPAILHKRIDYNKAKERR